MLIDCGATASLMDERVYNEIPVAFRPRLSSVKDSDIGRWKHTTVYRTNPIKLKQKITLFCLWKAKSFFIAVSA